MSNSDEAMAINTIGPAMQRNNKMYTNDNTNMIVKPLQKEDSACVMSSACVGVFVYSHEEAWPDNNEVLIHTHHKLPHSIQDILGPAHNDRRAAKCEVSTISTRQTKQYHHLATLYK